MKRAAWLFLWSVANLSLAFGASPEPHWFAGVALGRSSVDGPSQSKASSGLLFLTALPLQGYPLHDHDTAWSAFVGYTVTPHVALELGYWDHGTFRNESVFVRAPVSLGIKEWYFGPTLRFPLNERLALTGSAGISRAQFDVSGDAYLVVLPPGTVFPVPIFPGSGPILGVPTRVPFEQPADETGGFWRIGMSWHVSSSLEASLNFGKRDLQVQEVKTLGFSLQKSF